MVPPSCGFQDKGPLLTLAWQQASLPKPTLQPRQSLQHAPQHLLAPLLPFLSSASSRAHQEPLSEASHTAHHPQLSHNPLRSQEQALASPRLQLSLCTIHSSTRLLRASPTCRA